MPASPEAGHTAGLWVPTRGKEQQRQARKKWSICWPHGEYTRTEGPEVPFHSLSMILSTGCPLVGRPSSPPTLSAGVSHHTGGGMLSQHGF